MTDTRLPANSSCTDAAEPGLLPARDAQAAILEQVRPVSGTEYVHLQAALGRVCATPVHAPFPVPGHTNSAVDGYAVAARDLTVDDTVELNLVGSAMAGRPFEGRVPAGCCVRIMTGAPMPAGTDTVVMQEHASATADRVCLDGTTAAGANVRQSGEDLAEGDTVVPAQVCLEPAHLGLLASVGVVEVAVRRRPRVGLLSTGDEVCSPGTRRHSGQIFDSNRYSLQGALQRLGLEVLDYGIAPDSEKDMKATLQDAAARCDAVISSGGVSVGEADYVKNVLARLGKVDFWKVAIKPGRPLAFGHLGESLFFGLPGNPVAVLVTFYEFVQPALRRLRGEREVAPFATTARCESKLRKRAGRTEYQRGELFHDALGRLCVRRTGAQGSGILTSMARADCLIVLDSGRGSVEAGETVVVHPFQGLI